ncbi:MAG: hypothetical protein GKR89_27250 [Candidatus Latescibacteria bacterium]|nr:hypothetical protein [Candidatus Latescibacterota bacterium]
MLIDRAAGQVRLQHGRALLRVCRVAADDLGVAPVLRDQIDSRLRGYRPSGPGAQRITGAFDWEQHLVDQATAVSALYASSGLLLYGAAVWESVAGPKVRLESADIKALYNACGVGIEVVILPPQWNEE